VSASPEFPSDARQPPSREEHYVLEDLPARERMLFGALAYACFPVSIYYARWDPFVRFHVRQAVGVAILWMAAWFASGFWYTSEVPEFGALGYVVVTLLTCDGIYNALCIRFKPVRVVGGLIDRLPLPKKLAEPARR
jgi:hypothetical protein